MGVASENAIASKLLEAAVRLFAHKGYGATSTREIVEAANVTKPMLYYYFQSKEGLLAAALEHFADQFQQRIAAVISETGEPYENLVALVWAYLDFCQEHKSLARLFYALHFGPDDQKHLADLDRYVRATHDQFGDAAEHAVRGGLIRAESKRSLQMALRGMVHIWIMAALDDEAQLTPELARQIVDDLLSGYGLHRFGSASSHGRTSGR